MNVVDFYKEFRDINFKAVSFTSDKCNRAFGAFWSLCISSGCRFGKDDLLALRQWEKEDSWNIFHPPLEIHYSLAVLENNISFCQAYEKYKDRKPFIWKGIDYGYNRMGVYACHCTQDKSQGRLIRRAQFTWKGYRVEVTNFKDEKGSLIACAYDPDAEKRRHEQQDRRKPIRRFTITNQQLLGAKSAAKDKERHG